MENWRTCVFHHANGFLGDPYVLRHTHLRWASSVSLPRCLVFSAQPAQKRPPPARATGATGAP